MTISLERQVKKIARDRGVILLYHSVMDKVPPALGNTLHNVTVQQFNKHLLDLSDYFEFVSLDDFSQASSKAGLACVTFDDGYKNVLENALPILESLNYPFTIFVNPVTFDNGWNWRDKVRYIIYYHQVDDFLKNHELAFNKGRFYRYSKNPANNSAHMDAALDEFLAGRAIDVYGQYPYLSANNLINHPLVSYGNHSQNHYVLASLSEQQQRREIRLGHENLSKISNLAVSNCFSAPFGGIHDINSTTLEIVAKMSYHSLLMSRQLLQPKQSVINKVQILERYMPRSDNVISDLIIVYERANKG